MATRLGLFFVGILSAFLLNGCSEQYFNDCTDFSQYIDALISLFNRLNQTSFLSIYPSIWGLIVFRKMFL